MRRILLAPTLIAAIGLTASGARADERQWVLSPGPFFVEHVMKKSVADGDGVNVGGGVEVSLMRFPGPVYGNPAGYGVNAQLSILSLDHHAAWQAAINAQAGTFLGIEAGLFARSSAGRFGAEGGVRIAPYASFAFAWISMSLEIPIVRGDGPLHPGVGGALLCGFKFPLALTGGDLFPGPQLPKDVPTKPVDPPP